MACLSPKIKTHPISIKQSHCLKLTEYLEPMFTKY